MMKLMVLIGILLGLVAFGIVFGAIVYWEKKDVASGARTFDECRFIEEVKEK